MIHVRCSEDLEAGIRIEILHGSEECLTEARAHLIVLFIAFLLGGGHAKALPVHMVDQGFDVAPKRQSVSKSEE